MLTATAFPPGGTQSTPVTSSCSVIPRDENLTTAFDEVENPVSRPWTGGVSQVFTWGAGNRLVEVVQPGVNPSVWTALDDGLDRRVRATVTPHGRATAPTAGTPSALDDQVIWSGLQMSGYGVLPGFTVVSLEHSGDLVLSMNWQGRRVDPTGFYNMGTRSYDPESRRFLSADPLGHASSMDLYSYANGDPINHIDPDGRFARLVGDGISGLFEFTGLQSPITPERSMANSFSIGSNSFSIGSNSYQTISHINERYQPFEKAASAFVNMVPGVGTLKSFTEMSSGNDVFTGEQISQGGAAFNVVASALPVGMGGVSKWASTAIPGTLSAGLSGGGRGFAGTAGNPWGVAANRTPWTQVSSDARAILRGVEGRTGMSIPPNQRSLLADQVRAVDHRIPSGDAQYRTLQAEYRSGRSLMIADWQKNTGQVWPTGAQAHHVIPTRYGGPNQWWNIHPAQRSVHQGAIHGLGSPTQSVFPTPIPR